VSSLLKILEKIRKVSEMQKIFTDSEGEQDLNINTKYAEKFLKRKKSEEVSSLKRKFKENVVSDSSSSEEEDERGDLLTQEVDLEIENTLNLLKSKDSRIYDSGTVFFSAPDENSTETVKGDKPFRIKDYHRRELLGDSMIQPVKDSLVSNAEELKKEIKQAFGESVKEDTDNLFTVKEKKYRDVETDIKSTGLSEEDFLREYISKKRWMHVEDSTNLLLEEEEEERGIEATEEFEQKYNFRFEEQGDFIY
jgi:protein KRI1